MRIGSRSVEDEHTCSISDSLLCNITSTDIPRFIGEETYSAGSSKEYLVTDSPTWIVDPLDGTVNYTHLFPMFCVSIAFCLNGSPTIGVIYQPMVDTTYSALSGHGAWQDDACDGKRRRALPYVNSPKSVIPKNAPKGCIFSCEWGKDRYACFLRPLIYSEAIPTVVKAAEFV